MSSFTIRESKTRRNVTELFTEAQVDKLREIVEVDQSIREAKEQLQALQDRKRDLEQQILDESHDYPTQPPWKVNGMSVYIKEDVRLTVDSENRPQLIAALDRNGLEDLLKRDVNLNTLSSWYRDALKNEEPVPQDILDTCTVVEDYRIQIRKG